MLLKIKLKAITYLAVVIVIAACRQSEEVKEPATNDNALAVKQGNGAGEYEGIETTEPDPSKGAGSTRCSGHAIVPPAGKARISSFVAGFVKEADWNPGDRIRSGEVLITLENTSILTLQQEFIEAREKLRFLESVFENQSVLAAERVSSKRTGEQAKSDYYVQLAAFSSLAGQMKLLGIDTASVSAGNLSATISICAPYDATVAEFHAYRGMLISPGDVIGELIRPGVFQLRLKVFERDVSQIKVGNRVEFRLADETGYPRQGLVTAIGSMVNPGDRSIDISVSIEPASVSGITAGMFVEALVHPNMKKQQ